MIRYLATAALVLLAGCDKLHMERVAEVKTAQITWNTMKPHQQRVIDEYEELLDKMLALGNFFDNPLFKTLGAEEQERLERQWKIMQQYGQVLNERIGAFT